MLHVLVTLQKKMMETYFGFCVSVQILQEEKKMVLKA